MPQALGSPNEAWGKDMLSISRWQVGLLWATIWATAVAPVFGSDVPEGVEVGGRILLPDVRGGYASTHLVVKFKPAVLQQGPVIQPAARSGERAYREPVLSRALQAACTRWGATDIRPFYPYEFGNQQLAGELGLDRTFIVEVPTGTDVPAMVTQFRSFDAEVQTASLDGIGGVALMPNDSKFYKQWNMHNEGVGDAVEDADIDAPEAWDIHTGDGGTATIAIIDSGIGDNVLYPHVDFAGRMVPGINTIDPGLPDLITDECHVDDGGHGTPVAGIAAATGNNGVGVAGVSWGVRIMPVRVLGGWNGCWGDESHCAAGIIWAVDHGADVGNVSLAFDLGTETLEDAVDYAHGQGMLLVAAAGNHEGEFIAYPGRFENCVAVSSTTFKDILASGSNWGNELDVCAPGDNVWSTMLGNTYGPMGGTSIASPHVAGLAALIKSYVPGLTPDDIRGILTSTADDLVIDPFNPTGPELTGFDIYYGHGRINAHAALLAAGELTIRVVSSSPPEGAIDARQPFEPDGSNPPNPTWVDLTFDGEVFGLGTSDFSVETEGGGTPPGVFDVTPISDDTVTVLLDATIPIGAWTTVRHDFSGTGVRIGYLPGDVNGDAASNEVDVSALINALDGVLQLEIWQADVDRDGDLGPEDILRVIDLLNGAGVYDPYLDATLP